MEEALYNLFHVKQIVLSSFKLLKAVLLRKHIISSTLHFNMYCFAYAFEIFNYFGIRETQFLNLKNFKKCSANAVVFSLADRVVRIAVKLDT